MAISETTTDHATWSVTIGHIYVVLWCDLQKGRNKKELMNDHNCDYSIIITSEKNYYDIFEGTLRRRLSHGYYSLTAKYLSN